MVALFPDDFPPPASHTLVAVTCCVLGAALHAFSPHKSLSNKHIPLSTVQPGELEIAKWKGCSRSHNQKAEAST